MRYLAVVGVLIMGMISGSWVFVEEEIGNSVIRQLGNWENEIGQIHSIIKLEQNRGEVQQKVIDCIDRYNSKMADSLKNLIAKTIWEMSLKYDNLGIDTILAVISWESALTWNPVIVSYAGAAGLMQIMPMTGYMLAKQEGLVNFALVDLFNPIINIKLGCRYLSYLIQLYGSLDVALAAYNGGDKNARLFAKQDEENCHPQTWGYVPNVLKLVGK